MTLTLDSHTLKHLLQGIISTQPDEMGCDDCYEHLEHFVELVLAGKDPAKVLPLVQEHLTRCANCREEFEMLLDVLRVLA